MTPVSVLTLVRNREVHLHELVEGLRRSARPPDELIVIDMSDSPVASLSADFPIIIDRLETDGLPLASARNRAADLARHDRLIFLDVDCIPLQHCIGRLAGVLDARDCLACADVRYLGPDHVRSGWTDRLLLAVGRSHPARSFPVDGVRVETNPGLFWSLAFAIRRETFRSVGRFDETFIGYGAEDTDFGFRAAEAGIPLCFVGGAIACHQYHPTFDPPVQHLADIVANARRFRHIWGRWPMEGWLAAFHDMQLVDWSDTDLTIRRHPTLDEVIAAEDEWLAKGGR